MKISIMFSNDISTDCEYDCEIVCPWSEFYDDIFFQNNNSLLF